MRTFTKRRLSSEYYLSTWISSNKVVAHLSYLITVHPKLGKMSTMHDLQKKIVNMKRSSFCSCFNLISASILGIFKVQPNLGKVKVNHNFLFAPCSSILIKENYCEVMRIRFDCLDIHVPKLIANSRTRGRNGHVCFDKI